jgi:integrase
MSSLIGIVGGGIAGSSLTYALAWLRERRRTTDAYRAPQREAVAKILSAGSVSENAVQSGRKIHVGSPKSHKQRTVPLPASCCHTWLASARAKARDALLWDNGDGTHLRRPHPTSGWFAKAVKDSLVPRVTPHDLRHTAASAGANIKAVQRMLGHASAAMTLDIYTDLFDDDLEAVASALNEARTLGVGAS